MCKIKRVAKMRIFFYFFFGIYENKESSIILTVKKSVIHGLFGKAGFTKS